MRLTRIAPYRQEDPDNEGPCEAVGFLYADSITHKRVAALGI